MPGEDHRYAQQCCELRGDIAGVRVVTVDDLGNPSDLFDVPDCGIHETVQVGPQPFLVEIPFRSGRDTDEVGAFGEDLARRRVFGIDTTVLDLPGQQVDPSHRRVRGQCARLFHDVRHLATGIGVAPEFDVHPAHQTVDAEHNDVEAVATTGSSSIRFRWRLHHAPTWSGFSRTARARTPSLPAAGRWPRQRRPPGAEAMVATSP